ncbi:hypothetical protein AFLA_008412 [Aspergillus flavus NRRL3357]|nr:hypothetical protein AFLA_008412 [Aspergillus flavus NRRL3357]
MRAEQGENHVSSLPRGNYRAFTVAANLMLRFGRKDPLERTPIKLANIPETSGGFEGYSAALGPILIG